MIFVVTFRPISRQHGLGMAKLDRPLDVARRSDEFAQPVVLSLLFSPDLKHQSNTEERCRAVSHDILEFSVSLRQGCIKVAGWFASGQAAAGCVEFAV